MNCTVMKDRLNGTATVEVRVPYDEVNRLLDEFAATLDRQDGSPESHLAQVASLDSKRSIPGRMSSPRPDSSCLDSAHRELGRRAGSSARGFVISRLIDDVLTSADLEPMLTPGIHALEYPEYDSEYDFEVLVVERPQVSLSSYEPVTICMCEEHVDDEMVENSIASVLDDHATYVDAAARSAAIGDDILVNIVTYRNGELNLRLSGNAVLLRVDSSQMPEPFIEGVIGMGIGEKKEIEYTVLRYRGLDSSDVDSYRSTVEMMGQREKREVSLTDEWVAENFPDCRTVSGFRESIRQRLQDECDRKNRETRFHLINLELEKRFEGIIPDELYEASCRSQMDKLVSRLQREGGTLDEYCAKESINEEELSMQMLIKAGENLRQGLALEALFDGRSMELEEDDIRTASRILLGEEYRIEDIAGPHQGRACMVQGAAKRLKAQRWLNSTVKICAEPAIRAEVVRYPYSNVTDNHDYDVSSVEHGEDL